MSRVRQRYTTEPCKIENQMIRNSTKLASMGKAIPKKVVDFKHLTMKGDFKKVSAKNQQLFRQELGILNRKKTSFTVTKRKSNKSMTQQICNKVQQFQNTSWIQKIQFQTYQGQRDYNQDRLLIKQQIKINNQTLSLFAIFDGHGGSSASEFLKLNFTKTFSTFYQSCQLQECLKKTLFQLQNKIIKHGLKISSGSCATILVVKENLFWVANVGDSRVLVVKDLEQCKQITQDHKPQNIKQYKRIQNQGGKIYRNVVIDENTKQKTYGPFRVLPSKLSVTRTIGDFLIKKNQKEDLIIAEPQIFSGKIQYNDIFLLFSDGAYEQFTNNEISIIFANQTNLPLKQRMTNFMREVKKRGTADNTSIIAIQTSRKNKTPKTSSGSIKMPSFENIQIII